MLHWCAAPADPSGDTPLIARVLGISLAKGLHVLVDAVALASQLVILPRPRALIICGPDSKPQGCLIPAASPSEGLSKDIIEDR